MKFIGFTWVLIFGISISAHATEFKYKEIDEFSVLSDFSTVEDFEKSYLPYIQYCLDNTGGGTGGIRCLIDYGIWDRELNIYYRQLYRAISDNQKNLLKASQLAWLKQRDLSIEFNSTLLDLEYEDKEGTMYALMKASDANKHITPMIKHRTLVLRQWLEIISKEGKL